MKFVLVMLLCSNVPGNQCQPFEPKYNDFKTYHECARHGYNASADLMNNFSDKFIDEFNIYIVFSCEKPNRVDT
tara:strand:- start:296 stop:517 length:222 start_codon:yes stop_codon:yes gene_type:complete